MSKSEVTEWVSHLLSCSGQLKMSNRVLGRKNAGKRGREWKRRLMSRRLPSNPCKLHLWRRIEAIHFNVKQNPLRFKAKQSNVVQAKKWITLQYFQLSLVQANLQIWVENVEGGGWGGWGASWRKGSALMRDLSWNCQKHHRTHPHRHIHCQIVQKYSKLFSSCTSTSSFLLYHVCCPKWV